MAHLLSPGGCLRAHRQATPQCFRSTRTTRLAWRTPAEQQLGQGLGPRGAAPTSFTERQASLGLGRTGPRGVCSDGEDPRP